VGKASVATSLGRPDGVKNSEVASTYSAWLYRFVGGKFTPWFAYLDQNASQSLSLWHNVHVGNASGNVGLHELEKVIIKSC